MRVLSTFSGCGGADLGVVGGFEFNGKIYKKNGLDIVHASDIDKKAVATYNLNFEIPAIVADIRNLNFSLHTSDVVIGGFPCQSFSTVNPTKDPCDSKAQLYNDFVRVVGEIEPKVFIAENVRGFYSLKDGYFFKDFTAKMEKVGFRINHQILKAVDFGIPQRRERLFVVAVRRDIKKSFVFPQAIYGPNSKTKQSYVPIRNFLLKGQEVSEKYFFSERAVIGVKNAKKNMKRALAQSLDEPCLTITSHLAKVSLNSRDPVLLVNPKRERYRRFTPLEASRIQSFPDDFIFSGSEADAYRQIGNAIPPVLMWHLIRNVRKVIFE